MVLGHEVVGVVAREARDGSGPPAGTAVAVTGPDLRALPLLAVPGDRTCPECRYLAAPRSGRTPTAGFTTQLVVEAQRLVRLPAGLSLRQAVLAEPTSVAWHAVERAVAVATGALTPRCWSSGRTDRTARRCRALHFGPPS